MTGRQKWIAAAVAVLAVLVIFVWVLGGGRKDEGEGDEAEQVTSSRPKISRGSGGHVVVELSRDEQVRIGLETERVNAMTQSQAVTAYGVVLDPAPLAALDAELASARAAVAASRAEYERTHLLHSEQQNVSLKDLETARAKFQADQTLLNLQYQRLADEWGVRLSAMSPVERVRLIDALTKRIAGIIRISLPPGQPLLGEPKEARLVVLGYETQPLVTRTIWPAPTVDSHLQARASCSRPRRKDFRFAPAPPSPAIWRRPALRSRGSWCPKRRSSGPETTHGPTCRSHRRSSNAGSLK